MARVQKKPKKIPVLFQEKLVLNQWMLRLFGYETLQKLADGWNDKKLEGYNTDNTSRFHVEIKNADVERELSDQDLLRYDQNIFNHTKKLNKKRGKDKIVWKYFQYLALLFTEVYLDKYFDDPDAMLDALNVRVENFNANHDVADHIDLFEPSDLRRIAFYQATGSGKTLLMHINIMQYQHYLKKHKRTGKLNRVILITPRKELSDQHCVEFAKSGMNGQMFNQNSKGGFFVGENIDVINIQRLGDKSTEKTVKVSEFEDNNLVLVDEGHRGATGKEWMKRRNQLARNGFCFEYSATFEQAIKTSKRKEKEINLEQQYAKAILFNYSYKYFYYDGFGKDSKILNLKKTSDSEAHQQRYLTACMLTFYQQMRIFKDDPKNVQKFNLEKPLLVLVGARVSDKINSSEISDVEKFLRFLAEFVKAGQTTIDDILNDDTDMFSGAFAYLNALRMTPHDLFADIKTSLFNSSGGVFSIKHIKSSSGEIVLQLGEGDPFGFINVGNATDLIKNCKACNLFEVSEPAVSESYFSLIDEAKSPINILIGSKKFNEGWSSWRVSTMGLLNVGQGEGSEIIQLFGRGVRLKGIDFGLKRSSMVPKINPPEHIKNLETLNIFGVHAGYMEQFSKLLEDVGVPTNNQMRKFSLPLYFNSGVDANLKTIRLNKDMKYKDHGPRPVLKNPPKIDGVVLDCYPKIQAETSTGIDLAPNANRTKDFFKRKHLVLLDINQIFFDMVSYKNLCGLHNLNISRKDIKDLLLHKGWYELEIPKKSMDYSDSITKDIARWQKIAMDLMRTYIDRVYKRERTIWEYKYLEYHDLKRDDPNLLWNEDAGQNQWVISVRDNRDDIITNVEALVADIKNGKFKDESNPDRFKLDKLIAFKADRHIYQPLMYFEGKSEYITVKPTALNGREKEFVDDLKTYVRSDPPDIKDKQLYLLRNQGRGVGVGFFDEAGFYPDFILWIVDDDRQYISFIEPHGLRNSYWEDPKINLHKTIRDIGAGLENFGKKITLSSFIISTTPYHTKSWWKGERKIGAFHARNVFFQKEDKARYIRTIIERSLKS